ncbi:MAG: 2-amino-4-hydroxy-6-hydroxymethyldihydropteridine diphosphokinase [Burkholderiales bacterium]
MTAVYIGIGSNLDMPRAQVAAAFEEIAALPQTRLTGRSPMYLSEPVDAPAQPPYVNAVAAAQTALTPQALLAELQSLETNHGRERPFRNAPRTLDLDLLLFGEARLETPALTLPHPRMHLRAFVLRPLLDLDPQATVPGRGAASELLRACASQPLQRLG